MAAIQHSLRGGKVVALPGRTSNPAAAREAIADLTRSLQGLMDSNVSQRIIRPGITAGLRVIRDAISAAAPVNRRRIRAANRRFARRSRNMPVHALASAQAPKVSGRLKRSAGMRIKKNSRKHRIEGKVGLNVGKKPSTTPKSYAPHAHLVTLGTRLRPATKGGTPSANSNRGRMRSNRFVRRAASSASPRAKQVAITRIKQQIEKHLSSGRGFSKQQRGTINLIYSL
jgi:hypothetical protein